MQLSSTSLARLFLVVSLVFFGFATSIPAVPSLPRAEALSPRHKPKLPLSVEVIYEFPPGTFLENIAVRRNGQILTTVATAPEIYQVDPSGKRDPILLYSFPATTVTGIVELQPDVFYVATGNSSSDGPFGTVTGSFAVWKLNLRPFSISLGKPAEVTKIVTFPKARLLNGVAVLDHRKGLLLIADSLLGLIWRLNVYTKEIKVFTDDPLTKASPDSNLPIGVNGIKLYHGAVYFTNPSRNIIARLNFNHDGTSNGPAVIVVKVIGVDDFAIGSDGAFFAAVNIGSALAYASAAGGDVKILANITANPTAVAFGRTSKDARSVYLSSAGGPIEAFASQSPPRGRILKVDVNAFLNTYSHGH